MCLCGKEQGGISNIKNVRVWLGVHVQHSIKLAAGIVKNIIKLLLMLARSHP